MNKRLSFLFVAAAMLLLVGCNSDLHYAKSFIRKFDRNKAEATEKIYVVLPREVIHTNSTLNNIPGFSFMTEREQDSVIAAMTGIVDKINDSIFIDQFSQAFLYTLSRSKIPIVLVDDVSRLPKADDQHFVVNFVQLEAEEFLQPCRSEFKTAKGLRYNYDYDLRHFSTNVWLMLDQQDTLGQVCFRNDEVRETFRGTVKSIKDGKATMKTNFERINVNDAYRSARRLGSECTTLYVEKILAEYVCRTKGSNESYFLYNAGVNAVEGVVPYDEGIKESFEKLY